MHCCVKYNVVSFFIEYFHVLTISYSCVGKPVLPIGHSSSRANARRMSRHVCRCFHYFNCRFPKALT